MDRLLFLFAFCIAAAYCNKHFQETDVWYSSDGTQTDKNPVLSGGTPWPMPASYKKSDKFKVIDQDFVFSTEEFTCGILEQAFSRYYKIIFDLKPKVLKFYSFNIPKLERLQVILQNPCEKYPDLNSSEAYNLVIDDDSSTLKAKSVWGILRGLETFSQVVHEIDGRPAVNYTWIDDFPRFPWRGVLLDSSRHYLPIETILHSLDAMSYNKINVFHWHIVDDNSFPYNSYTFPDLSLKGSYHPYTHVYTQADVARIIQYARLRGIRVVVEFDTPGHMKSWGRSLPGLLTECYTSSGKPSGSYGPIDPSKNTTFQFIEEFFAEIAQVFPDGFVHLGGDEVDFSCWKSNPLINAFMKQIKIEGNYTKLESYYVERLLKVIEKLKKNYIVWQEVFDNGDNVDPSTVIHVWKGQHELELERVTAAGLKAILSSPWYLDYVAYGAQWRNYYGADPHNFNGTSVQKSMVMGGEACLWGEFVDSTNLHSRLWPSASAIAERLWSPKDVKDVNDAAVRLDEHRCRMLRRGIMAGPPSGPGFCKNEVSI